MGKQNHLFTAKRGSNAVSNQLLGIRIFDRILQAGVPVVIDITSVSHFLNNRLSCLLIIGIDTAARETEYIGLHTRHFIYGLSCFLKIRHITVHTLIQSIIIMAVTVNSYGMPFRHNPPRHVGMLSHILPHQEKGGFDIPVPQDIQHFLGIFLRRPVIKSQIHGLWMKIIDHTLYNAIRNLLLVLDKAESLTFRRIGKKTRLNQTGRHRRIACHMKVSVSAQFPLHSPCALYGLLVDQLCQSLTVAPGIILLIPYFHPAHPGTFICNILMDADINIGP